MQDKERRRKNNSLNTNKVSLSCCSFSYLLNDNKYINNDQLIKIEKKVKKSEDKEICCSLHTIYSYEQKCETKVTVNYVNIYLNQKKKELYLMAESSSLLVMNKKSIDHPMCMCVHIKQPEAMFYFFFVHFSMSSTKEWVEKKTT